MAMTDDWRAAAEARCEAATEGPWLVEESDGYITGHITSEHHDYCGTFCKCARSDSVNSVGTLTIDDANFIAHARTDLPRALAELREKDAEIERRQNSEQATDQLYQRWHNRALGAEKDRDAWKTCAELWEADCKTAIADRDRLAARVRKLEGQLTAMQQIEKQQP